METGNCKDCGLLVKNETGSYCFKTDEQISNPESRTCSQFIPLQYDGDLPYTPEEHIYLHENIQKKKTMTNRQGLRF